MVNFENFYNVIYSNIAGSYTRLMELDSAVYYAEKVTNSKHSYGESNFYVVPRTYLTLSEIYSLKGDYKRAFNMAFKALFTADSSNLSQVMAESYNFLAELYVGQGNYKSAFEFKNKANLIYDSIFTEEKYKIQNDLEAVYETDKKQKAIDDLSKENEITKLKNQRFKYFMYLSSFMVFLVFIIAILLIRQNKNRAKQESLELEQKLLRTQMNPHFIFNSVSAIQDFILKNDSLEASSYLSHFAKLMRAILSNSSDNFITLEKDIETISHYLKLQHLRLADKFKYTIDVSDLVNTNEDLVPPMLIQPFIENSIEHGILKKPDGLGLITVRYYTKDNYLIIETEDNGVGRKEIKSAIHKNYKSKAIEITKQRIKLLSKTYKEDIQFNIFDLKHQNGMPSGTMVQFRLPHKYS